MFDVVIYLGCLDLYGLGGRYKFKFVVVMWIVVYMRLVWSVVGYVE